MATAAPATSTTTATPTIDWEPPAVPEILGAGPDSPVRPARSASALLASVHARGGKDSASALYKTRGHGGRGSSRIKPLSESGFPLAKAALPSPSSTTSGRSGRRGRAAAAVAPSSELQVDAEPAEVTAHDRDVGVVSSVKSFIHEHLYLSVGACLLFVALLALISPSARVGAAVSLSVAALLGYFYAWMMGANNPTPSARSRSFEEKLKSFRAVSSFSRGKRQNSWPAAASSRDENEDEEDDVEAQFYRAVPTRAPSAFSLDVLESASTVVAAACEPDASYANGVIVEAVTFCLTSCVDPVLINRLKLSIDRGLRESFRRGETRFGTLHALIYQLLPSGPREIVLSHFESVFRASKSGSLEDGDHSDSSSFEDLTKSKDVGGTRPRQRMVVSDIDDTVFPTFKDRRGYTWGAPYPGVRSFLKELLLLEDESEFWEDRIAFVTARPGFLGAWTKRELARAGFSDALVLMGTTTSATSAASMLARKVQACRELCAMYPDRDLILVGDNGQYDIDLGALLLSEKLVTCVVIHDIFEGSSSASMPVVLERPIEPAPLARSASAPQVATLGDEDAVEDIDLESLPSVGSPVSQSSAMMGGAELSTSKVLVEHSVPKGFRHEDCARVGILLCQTYAGAALACHGKAVVDLEAVLRVTKACASELGAAVNKMDPASRAGVKLKDALLRDVARVAARLDSSEERVALLEEVHAKLRGGETASAVSMV